MRQTTPTGRRVAAGLPPRAHGLPLKEKHPVGPAKAQEQSVKTIKNMPVLESTGFIPQVFPLVILMTLFFVLNAKIFLPTLGQIFAVRKQSSFTLSNMTTAPSVTTSSLKTSIFSSPGSLEGKSLKAGSSLHSVLQTQFSKNVNPSLLSEQKLSDDSKKLQDLISYKVK
jgi:hypothetical protein